ncbi:MAG TPA: FMN-binding negative transcriptional regulator, partial [Anaerolineales bacterium]|nr:FMN-binding negative transcriptional regulator [Anaerolineales bacterium]
YVTPTWYQEHDVPTWNYAMIHLYGKPEIMTDPDEFRTLLSRLIQRHEAAHEEYRLESLPPEFVEKEMRGAVGIKMDVMRIDAGFKLSQNRNDEDYQNIITKLDKRPDEMSHGVGKAMKEKRAL